jgi:pentatricopeptide repeat-containing protein PET309
MLERASTCLESGGRQLLRAPKSCIRTRRSLHSAFWHHGASDLSLPAWWAAATLFDSGRSDTDDRAAGTVPSLASNIYNGVLLDFLYPEKTLALLKRATVTGPSGFELQKRKLHGTSRRPYLGAQPEYQGENTEIDEATAEEVEEEMMATKKDPRAPEKLSHLLARRELGNQDGAWQLYAAIPPHLLADGQCGELQANLLEYLNVDDDPAVPNRVLQVFDALPDSKRRTSSYRAAIVAQIALREMGPALHLLDDAPRRHDFDFTNLGYDVIMRRTVLGEDWDLSFRVFRAFLQTNPNRGNVPMSLFINWGNQLPEVWRGVASLPRLQDVLTSFLGHVKEYQHEFTSTGENRKTLALFTTTFIPNVMEQVFCDPSINENGIKMFLLPLFTRLKSRKLPTPMIHEYALKKLLDLPEERAMRVIPDLITTLHMQYRQKCSASSSSHVKPSLNLLRNMIVYYCDRGNLARAEEVVQDHRLFYPREPMRAGLLTYLLHCYADYGNAARVEQYFLEFTSHYKDMVDLNLLSALPFAYARRADVQGAHVQFDRIRTEFGLEPDTACWNILLLAYARADDLDGALEVFNTSIDSGIAPDVYTFGPLLDLCAQRGDVEAFEALFSRADQMGVPMAQDVRARSGYVQAFLNAGDLQGAEAIANGMLKSWHAKTLNNWTLTHTWNLLIQHHALNQDLAGARARYREMVTNGIEVDSWTYSSIMRALVEVNQTNAAFKLLRKTMPASGLTPHALHYAIVMTGFLREGGGQAQLAVDVHRRMIEQGVPQTDSSREATIRTLGKADLDALGPANKLHTRLEQAEQAVEDILFKAVDGQTFLRQPKHSKQMDSRNFGAAPQSYYGLLISMYATRGAYPIAKKLLRKAETMGPDVDNFTLPMTLITGAMEVHLKAGEHAEVAKYWALARASAAKMTNTFSQIMNPEEPAPEDNSLVDPAIRARFQQSRIAPNRRNILFQASRFYVRSLLDPANPAPDALQEAQRTMRELLVGGYTLDVFTWNELIQTLAERDSYMDAFAICEEFLMPSFPGWRNLYPTYSRKDRRGYRWMEFRHYEITRTSIMPRYKTLIIMTAAFQKIRADELNGIGFDEEAGGWLKERLSELAPNTVRAIETMPRTSDMLQEQYFHRVK